MEPRHPLPFLASLSLARELHNGTQPSPKGLWATQSSPWKLTINSSTAFGLRRPRLWREHPCRKKCALSSVSDSCFGPAPLDLMGGRNWRGFYLLMEHTKVWFSLFTSGTERTPFRCVTYITHRHHSHSCSPGASLFWCGASPTLLEGSSSYLAWHFVSQSGFCCFSALPHPQIPWSCLQYAIVNSGKTDFFAAGLAMASVCCHTSQSVIFQTHTNTDHFLNKMCNWVSILRHSL